MQDESDSGGSMPTAYGQWPSLEGIDPAELDYSAFLQGEPHIDYLAEESSASTSTSTSTAPLSLTAPSSFAALSDAPLARLAPLAPLPQARQFSPSTALTARAPHGGNAAQAQSSVSPRPVGQIRQRLERRGHTKSRRGCFNCKKRRIKVRFCSPS